MVPEAADDAAFSDMALLVLFSPAFSAEDASLSAAGWLLEGAWDSVTSVLTSCVRALHPVMPNIAHVRIAAYR